MSVEDQELLKLLEVDAAFPNRASGRFILGEPQDVVALLNEAENLDGLATEASADPESVLREGSRRPLAFSTSRQPEFKHGKKL